MKRKEPEQSSSSSLAAYGHLPAQRNFNPQIPGLNVGNIFPDQLAFTEQSADPKLLNSLNANKKVIRCILNLSDPAQWQGDAGKAALERWVSQERAAGCTARAAEIIKRHEAFAQAGYQVEIVVPNISQDKLTIIRKVQTDRYKQFYQEKFNQALPENFVLPVTFIALTSQARQKLIDVHQYPAFEFDGQKYCYPKTFVVDESRHNTHQLDHQHIDVKTFNAKDANNACALEAENILKAVQPKLASLAEYTI